MFSRLGYGLRGGALSAVTLETLSSSTLLFRSAARELTLVNTRVSCSFGLVNRILQPLSSVRLFAVSSETPEGFVLARHLSERHERTIQRMPAPRLVSSRLVSSRPLAAAGTAAAPAPSTHTHSHIHTHKLALLPPHKPPSQRRSAAALNAAAAASHSSRSRQKSLVTVSSQCLRTRTRTALKLALDPLWNVVVRVQSAPSLPVPVPVPSDSSFAARRAAPRRAESDGRALYRESTPSCLLPNDRANRSSRRLGSPRLASPRLAAPRVVSCLSALLASALGSLSRSRSRSPPRGGKAAGAR